MTRVLQTFGSSIDIYPRGCSFERIDFGGLDNRHRLHRQAGTWNTRQWPRRSANDSRNLYYEILSSLGFHDFKTTKSALIHARHVASNQKWIIYLRRRQEIMKRPSKTHKESSRGRIHVSWLWNSSPNSLIAEKTLTNRSEWTLFSFFWEDFEKIRRDRFFSKNPFPLK